MSTLRHAHVQGAKRRLHRGVSLLEIVVVLIVFASLTAVSVAAYNAAQRRSIAEAARASMQEYGQTAQLLVIADGRDEFTFDDFRIAAEDLGDLTDGVFAQASMDVVVNTGGNANTQSRSSDTLTVAFSGGGLGPLRRPSSLRERLR